MAKDQTEIAVIGGGAAGIAAARHLHDAGIDCLLIEARDRLGGRAWTVADASGFALDLGCGWLHSADVNPWGPIAQAQGRAIDKTMPPWTRPALADAFPVADQHAFRDAMDAFFTRMSQGVGDGSDRKASDFLEPGSRWNSLLTAVGTYIAGAELDKMSALDFDRYEDSEINWRVMEGYGTTIAAHAGNVPVTLGCTVQRIDHSGKRLKIETAKGVIEADNAIVTLPTNVIAETPALFSPALPDKTLAAGKLPLGLADKLFIALEHAEEFGKGTRLFGRTDTVATGSYHFRPFGRPMIECYFAGDNAHALERGGVAAFFDFAVTELTGHLGSDFAKRLKPVAMHPWASDPFARGSYSYAVPGGADCRATLAAPVDDRLFFAGEACSPNFFSTAHGACFTGIAAAEQVIAARK